MAPEANKRITRLARGVTDGAAKAAGSSEAEKMVVLAKQARQNTANSRANTAYDVLRQIPLPSTRAHALTHPWTSIFL